MNIKRPKSLNPGSVLQSRYTIESPLGHGGFAAVYRAVQNATGQTVAIKVMHAPDEAGAIELGRFEREMQLVGQLKHPNIVGLVDSGRMANDELFIALEYIDGIPLSDLIERDGALSLRQTVRLMSQVLEAMAFAHRRGIVHRDLKPANIMVTEPGRRANAVVLDFGIAGLLESAQDVDYQTLTADGQLPGTPAYMAPEQFNPKVPITPALDVYAWGLVTIECLTGHLACDEEGIVQTMIWQTSDDPVPVPDALRGTPLYPILQRATAKPLEQRYASANEVLAELEQVNLRDPVFDGVGSSLKLSAGARAGAATLDPDDQRLAELSGDGGAVIRAVTDAASLAVEDTAEADISPELLAEMQALAAQSGPGQRHDPFVAQSSGALQTDLRLGDGQRSGSRVWWVVGAVGFAVLLGLLAWILVSAGAGGTTEESPAAGAEQTLATPECSSERVALEGGGCCWPGQQWDASSSACTGTPTSCPEGTAVNGTDCSPEAAPADELPERVVLTIGDTTPSDAEVVVDGRVLGSGAGEYSIDLDAASFVLVLRATGHASRVTVHEAAETLDVGNVVLKVATRPDVPKGMVYVAEGSFWMGCREGDASCQADEKPGRVVKLGAYAIDETEVSREAYAACEAEGSCTELVVPAGKTEVGCHIDEVRWAGHPTVCVTWAQAQAYCEWRDAKLPTEAQWERAARGDVVARFPWGDAAPSCETTSWRSADGPGCGARRPRHVWFAPAGRSPFGVNAMSGNVSEWIYDGYAEGAYRTLPAENPVGPHATDERVKRGGDYEDEEPAEMRPSMRDFEKTGHADDDLGFRCARSF